MRAEASMGIFRVTQGWVAAGGHRTISSRVFGLTEATKALIPIKFIVRQIRAVLQMESAHAINIRPPLLGYGNGYDHFIATARWRRSQY